MIGEGHFIHVFIRIVFWVIQVMKVVSYTLNGLAPYDSSQW